MINLNAPEGLQNAVGQTAGLLGTLSSLLGTNVNQWQLKEGSYNGIRFHVLNASQTDSEKTEFDKSGASNPTYNASLPKISDSGGRRKIKYLFPYRDGQTTDDLGKKAKVVRFGCDYFGKNYLDGMNALISQMDSPTPFPGILTHPVMGNIPCVMEEYVITHQSEQRKAAAMRIVFLEHAFDIPPVAGVDHNAPKVSTIKSALSKAIGALQTVTNVLNKVIAFKFTAISLKNQVSNLLSSYSDFYSNFLINMNVTYNAGTSTDIPSLLPAFAGGTAGTTQTTFPTAPPPSDPFSRLPIATTQAPVLTTQQAANNLNNLRGQAGTIISLMESANNGMGALQLHDEILSIKQTAIDAQDVLDSALASSQFQILQFTTPRLMSIREVAYSVGLSPDRGADIINLNPLLESVNYIPAQTVLAVPAE